MQGWISLHRQIQEHWLWEDKPFSKGQAWIDILLMANHTDNKFLLGSSLVEVKKGCFITSRAKLMKRWGWGNTKLNNFLKLLKQDNMIDFEGQKHTLIQINNYEIYQKQTDDNQVKSMVSEDKQIDNKSLTNHKQIDNKSLTNDKQTESKSTANTNNNDNNVNNDNNKKNNRCNKSSNPDVKIKFDKDSFKTYLMQVRL